MTRPEREQWGELRKFMVKVKSKYPTSQCFLKKTTLFVDNRCNSLFLPFQLVLISYDGRMFIWSLEENRVTEQAIITIPTTQSTPMPKLNVQNRCPAKIKLEEFQENDEE